MGLLDGKAGLVTGAASGIGRASALGFAAEGARVVVSDIDNDGGLETVRLVQRSGGEATFVPADTSREDEVQALVAATVAVFGRLDWAHNNAGLAAPTKPVTEQQQEWWDRVLGIDLVGVMFGLKYQITQMLAQGDGGAVVNTASTAGLTGQYGLSPYIAAKWGVIGLTKTAALEYASEGIRVNAICPGMTSTPAMAAWAESVPQQAEAVRTRIPVGRMATPEEQANAAVWLCSPKASYVTGVALPVDGGDTID